MRHFERKNSMKARIVRVEVDEALHDVAHDFSKRAIESLSSDLGQSGSEALLPFGEVGLEDGANDGVLIAEVFIERAHRDPGPRGDVIGGRSGVASSGENPSSRR